MPWSSSQLANLDAFRSRSSNVYSSLVPSALSKTSAVRSAPRWVSQISVAMLYGDGISHSKLSTSSSYPRSRQFRMSMFA
jgi:hypothetical protein